MPTAEEERMIELLGLEPHPEGGFFRETWRSPLAVGGLPHGAPRSASTAIYFLLPSGSFSALHRVASDEVWHHYAGDALELTTIDDAGTVSTLTLGDELARGQRPQAVVPAHVFQAARPRPGGAHGYVLCGCTVAPGFEFSDFELPSRAALRTRFPALGELVDALTRP